MKTLINDVDKVVDEQLEGLYLSHADLVRVDAAHRVGVRAIGAASGKVGVVSGGGSGHELLHGGYVGLGMLDAACAGQVFTSPTPDQIQAADTAVNSGAGVLHIVKNYTGDIMNFEMAAELAAAEDIAVQQVVIDDDVAVQNSLYTAGRRGVGATVLAEKLIGALAERRADLAAVAPVPQRSEQSRLSRREWRH